MRHYSPRTAAAVVIANMVGTGVFTSLGFQLANIASPSVIMLLWLVGGLTAFCGALCYAELGAALPRSGGEYHFLGQIYHPSMGFVSGWISSTIGFAAPTALAAMTFAHYASSVWPEIPIKGSAVTLILLLATGHALRRSGSAWLQNLFTAAKITVILAFCGLTFLAPGTPAQVDWAFGSLQWQELLSGAFAVNLIYVNYAFNGWNAATYISGELPQPQRHLPRVLIISTGIVMALYLLLNAAFLHAAPREALVGQVEIGAIAANALFGAEAARWTGGILALLLVSTCSAMIIAGPRVLQVIGEDFRAFRWLARTTRDGLPFVAIFFQTTLSIVFIATSTFESILVVSGFVLALNNLFTVLGVSVLRRRHPELPRPYRTSAYPLPVILYTGITCWTLLYLLVRRTDEAIAALLIVMAGFVFYGLSLRWESGLQQSAAAGQQRPVARE